MADVVIVSGSGDYLDRWHPFAETSAELASVITETGHAVEVRTGVEESLLSLGDPGLLVINVGNPRTPRPVSLMIEVQEVLLDHLARGGGLLGMHVSATSFTAMPRWPEILGGRWVRGTTMHPPLDRARIRLVDADHPIVAGPSEIEVVDERYSYLDVRADVTVLGEHTYEGAAHPMIWTREPPAGRVVYDGLGHDRRSYESPGHRALLQRAVSWLLRE